MADDEENSQVELVDAPISIDDCILDDLAVRFYSELAAIKAGIAKEIPHHINGRKILNSNVDGRKAWRDREIVSSILISHILIFHFEISEII